MRKIFFALIFILIVHCALIIDNCMCQSGWYWFNPYPSNKTIKKIQFLNNNTGYSIIESRFYKTTNGGSFWFIPGDTLYQYISSSSSNCYRFFDATTGILFADKVYKTINGGLNWNIIYNWAGPSSADILDLNTWYFTYVINSPIGGTFSYIRYTSNGGLNWSDPYNPTVMYLNSIKILSDYCGYAAALDSNGYVFLCKSFGPASSWFLNNTSLTSYYTIDVFVKDSLKLFITNNQSVLKSTDGGYNWQATDLTDINDMRFLNSNVYVAAGKNGKIYRSTNSGLNWYQAESPTSNNLYSISFINQETGIITGDLGAVLRTTNNGQNWTSDCRNFTTKNLNDVRFLGKDTVLIAADSGYIYRSSNMGTNWVIYNLCDKRKIRKMFFINNLTGFAIADSGYFIKTTNSGISWKQIDMGYNDWFMLDVFFLNQNTGFISTGNRMGATGHAYRTTNGGENWIMLSQPRNANFFFIRFIDEVNGFLCGWENIYRTTNLGDTWIQMETNPNSMLHWDVSFINNLTGFTGGGDGYIHKTTNGGYNWFRTQKLVSFDVVKINFLNEQTGYATAGQSFTGSKSGIFCTTNSGYSWFQQYVPYGTGSELLSSFAFCDANTGFVVGNKGIVLKTNTGGFVSIKNISENNIPLNTHLFQNYPNPFNPTTKIKFEIPSNVKREMSNVKLIIYDILGKEIQTLVNEQLQPGTYEVTFDGSNLPSGIYFYQLRTGDFVNTKKLILLK